MATTVFLPALGNSDFDDLYTAIMAALQKASGRIGIEALVVNGEELARKGRIPRAILTALIEADIVVADQSLENSGVSYQIGYAHALGKPVIILEQTSDASRKTDFSSGRMVLYEKSQVGKQLEPRLIEAFIRSIEHPQDFMDPLRTSTRPKFERPTAFISYSHADRLSLDRLRVHLKPLERQGIIDIWDDSKLRAGDRWQAEIQAALERAAIAVLLISADFLASDFIVDNELPPLLAAAEEKGTSILPVILNSCRFSREPTLSRFQAINSPMQPLLRLPPVEQEAIFEKLAERIEAEVRPWSQEE